MKHPCFRVKAYKGVERQISRLPKAIQVKLFEFVELLETNPKPKRKGFRHLGENQYRCWLGLHHRVEWMVDEEAFTVIITNVGSRERM
jgi:mRNA-degrading endonuclease RelE of RelBE toxin-antitoxin system